MSCFGKEYGDNSDCTRCKVKRSCYREMKVKPSVVLPSDDYIRVEEKKNIHYLKCFKKPERIMNKEDK